MKEWVLDLHIHSVLSPCGGDDMLPPQVIMRAKEQGIDAIAITDHNSAENAASFIAKGRELGVTVFPGMELQTSEDIHLLCLFDDLNQLIKLQAYVYSCLPAIQNKKSSFGEQWVVDKDANKLGEVERILLVGTSLTVEQAVVSVQNLGGLCLAAHIDRQAFSLWGHLGYLPPSLPLDGIELTPHLPRDPVQLDIIAQLGYLYITSSDAHYLNDIRPPHCFAFLEECTLKEIKMALKGQDGRYIRTLR